MKKLLAFAYELMNNMVLKGLGIMNCMMLLWVAMVCSLCFSGCGLAKGMRGVDELVLDEAWVEEVTGFLLQNEDRPIPFYASLEEAVDSLAMGNHVSEYGNNGWGGIPKAYRFARQMELGFSPEQLDSLARHHASPAVRAVAGRILIDAKSPLARRLVMSSLSDTGRFELQCFDVIYADNVANYWVERARKAHILVEADSLRLVDTLIFSPNKGHLVLRNEVLQGLGPQPQYYEVFRRILVEEQDPAALPWVAQYRRIEDTALVLEALRCYSADDSRRTDEERRFYNMMMARRNGGLLAVAEWPHPVFMPLLGAIRDDLAAGLMDRGGTRYLFSAVMAYRSEWSLQFIKETFTMVSHHEGNEPKDYYDGVGMWTRWWGECFDRAYELNPDEYYAKLHKKYAYESNMGW